MHRPMRIVHSATPAGRMGEFFGHKRQEFRNCLRQKAVFGIFAARGTGLCVIYGENDKDTRNFRLRTGRHGFRGTHKKNVLYL